jgi:hypothetical protein
LIMDLLKEFEKTNPLDSGVNTGVLNNSYNWRLLLISSLKKFGLYWQGLVHIWPIGIGPTSIEWIWKGKWFTLSLHKFKLQFSEFLWNFQWQHYSKFNISYTLVVKICLTMQNFILSWF